MSATSEVVITGVGVATPFGDSFAATWKALQERRSAFTPIQTYNAKGSVVSYGGQCPLPDLERLPNRKVSKVLSRKDLIGLVTLLRAKDDAGPIEQAYEPQRRGLYIGVGCNQPGDFQPYFLPVASCLDEAKNFDSAQFGRSFAQLVNPMFVMQTMYNNVMCYGAHLLEARGCNANFMEWETSGLKAVAQACADIRENRVDVAFAGGIAASLDPFYVTASYQQGLLINTKDTDLPIEKRVRPFDAWRTGTLLSEGSCFVVMEKQKKAEARGAKIYGRILSPVRTNDIGMIMAHASGQKQADSEEAIQYQDLLRSSSVPICSVKGLLGEMAEAGGPLNLILALESLRCKQALPTFNFTRSDADTRNLSICDEPQPIKNPFALVTGRSRLKAAVTIAVGL